MSYLDEILEARDQLIGDLMATGRAEVETSGGRITALVDAGTGEWFIDVVVPGHGG